MVYDVSYNLNVNTEIKINIHNNYIYYKIKTYFYNNINH